MAWTTPKTWAVDELLTAAALNEQLRDNLNALKAPPMAIWQGELADGPGSTSWANVDAANLAQTITPSGNKVLIQYVGYLRFNVTDGKIAIDVYRSDTSSYLGGGTDGLMQGLGSAHSNMSFSMWATGLTPGAAVTFTLRFKDVDSSNGVILESRQFCVVEMS